MLQRLVLIPALALASATAAATNPAAMKVLPDYSQLVFVGQATGMGGQTVGFYIDPATIQRNGEEASVETTQYAQTAVSVSGQQVRFVEMRFDFDCAQQTVAFGDLVALDSSGKVVARQDGLSPAASLAGQSTVQAMIGKAVCK